MTTASLKLECRVLIDLLGTEWSDLRREGRPFWPHEVKSLRQLMLDDFVTKTLQLPDSDRDSLWAELGVNAVLGEKARHLIGKTRQNASGSTSPQRSRRMSNLLQGVRPVAQNKKTADFLILTVLPIERDAVLAAFGRALSQKEDLRDRRGNRFYKIPITSSQYEHSYTAWLAMVGRPKNVPCAVFVNLLSKTFDFKAIALIGIAGGNKEKVKLADVVSSTTVLDNDGGVDG
ncbi:MAG: hypothetical protein WAW96_09130, partial [Alphaproteobacteria bacterium]